jgi:hypothetical protein
MPIRAWKIEEDMGQEGLLRFPQDLLRSDPGRDVADMEVYITGIYAVAEPLYYLSCMF